MTTGTVAIAVEHGVTHNRVTFDFTSTAEGAAGDTTEELFNGAIEQVLFSPGSGDNQPSDDWDAVLTDSQGADMLCGRGADLDNASIVVLRDPFLGILVNSALTLAVTNFGNAKTGQVSVFIKM